MPGFQLVGGERGIRTPGPLTVNGFQDRRIRPLCHLSAANVVRESQICKKYLLFMWLNKSPNLLTTMYLYKNGISERTSSIKCLFLEI